MTLIGYLDPYFHHVIVFTTIIDFSAGVTATDWTYQGVITARHTDVAPGQKGAW